MAHERTPSSWNPNGLQKANSNASADARSIRSHDSLTVLGSHPLGSLRVHHPDDPSTHQADAGSVGDREDGPSPPLHPAADTATTTPATATTTALTNVRDNDTTASQDLPARELKRSSRSGPRDSPIHGMGGGDVVLILDLPEVFVVGYDAVSFTAKHFGGVRNIPAGPHFFWVAHPDGGSARSGFWIISSGVDRVHVMQWDKFNEGLLESARAEACIQADNIDGFYAKLVPYQDPTAVSAAGGCSSRRLTADSDNNSRIWEQLTGGITETVLSRVTMQQGSNWHVHTADRAKGAILLAAEMELDKTMSNPLFQSRELNFGFSQHSKTYSANSFGADRTLAATDATSHITSMVDAADNNLSENDIVGEFQFAYLVGMLLGNESCVQQWWYMLLSLIMKAYLLPERRPALAAALLQTTATQLNYGSGWLDGSILDYGGSSSHEMRLALIVYKRRLEELISGLGAAATPEQLAVDNAFANLEAAVVAFGWEIRGDYLRKGKVMMEDGEEVELSMAELQAEDERGEWAPEVVELDEHGRQRDLVSWGD